MGARHCFAKFFQDGSFFLHLGRKYQSLGSKETGDQRSFNNIARKVLGMFFPHHDWWKNGKRED